MSLNLGWKSKNYMTPWLLLLTVTAMAIVESCPEEEMSALQEIKGYMNSQSLSPYSGWPNDHDQTGGPQRDCCAWKMVRCDPTTRRVTELDLSSFVVKDYLSVEQQKLWSFNVTKFRPFSQLISLDLSFNFISGLVESNGSTWISTLKNLQVFNLDGNYFELAKINLGALTSLKNLSLQNCRLNYNSSFSIQEFAKLKELQMLDLSHNSLQGSIQALCKLKNLWELHLGDNRLNSTLPSCLGSLTLLRILDLYGNHLSGKFPNILPNLTSLEYFSLSDNSVVGNLSLSSLANHSKLQHLLLSRNKLEIQTEDSLWQPTFQLQSLALDGCSLNNLDGTIPRFLLNQHNLIDIDLSHNNLIGAFPTWLLNNNSQLRSLYLINNRLNGTFQLTPNSRFSLDTLGISGNNFHGELPEKIGSIFPNMSYLNMSFNHFEGHIPVSIGEMRSLQVLDLSNNNLSGELPRNLLSLCDKLEILQVSDNHLQGDVTPEYMNLSKLSWLKLSNNMLGGTLKDSLLISAQYLGYLDISNNKVTGQIPDWIGNLSGLGTLSVSGNLLQGQIPIEICNTFSDHNYIDLSHNDFTGPIPSCSDFSSVYYMHLHKNRLTGPIPDSLSSGINLATLDLRDNDLSGSIPSWINGLSSLSILLLGGNHLQGQVPNQLCQLGGINILDLSRNKLSGELPPCLGNLSSKRVVHEYYTQYFLFAFTLVEELRDFSYYPTAEEVQILVKNQYLNYTGGNLVLMSGLDLSCNNLSGAIPHELGDLTQVHSLNLSHNSLSGSIPDSFSQLRQIESLDISYNKLSGMIPPQLVDLNFLSTFNVSYNNLTGQIPETGQFGTFGESTYVGNQGLCGLAVKKSCNPSNALPSPTTKVDEGQYEDTYIDMMDFYWSFGVSCVIALSTTIAVLCINPQLRGSWFHFVDRHIFRRDILSS